MRVLGIVACAWLVQLLLLQQQLAGASHVVYDDLDEIEAAAAAAADGVPPSIVDSQLRTGYHFQPPKNWINGYRAPPESALFLRSQTQNLEDVV
ncbi:hypothetical protein GUJ93_ZPchr0004g39258 [Zizania palustris]|uniref:Uncharacterized protein n=1 Tax=Zizania palustris TaxID=103762 RepID=A0A8J5V8K4_ZIZPA|nr:hypothetical protein GUJ93_ZPchr0004g39258 [Zizania palustris]